MTARVLKPFVAAVAAMLIAANGVVTAQGSRLPPADEATADITWMRFKARLLNALAKRDQNALMSSVDTRIRNTSDKNGVAEFRRLWKPQFADSALWSELPRLLFLGGAYIKREKGPREFCAPYIYYLWPDDASGAVDAAIIARETLLKAQASSAAETLQTLSYDLVQALDWEIADENPDSKQKWVKVQAKSGVGYVPEEQIRSPLEHRACFSKGANGWRMTSFELGE